MPIHHLGFKVANFTETRDFYLAALKPLGYKVKMSYLEGKVLGLGTPFNVADFWLADPDVNKSEAEKTSSEQVATTAAAVPTHIAFSASNRVQVREFYEAAIAAGGKCNGPPGIREYFPTYYAAFVLDPDGRNIEAVCLKPAFWAEPLGWVGWGVSGAIACVVGGCIGKWVGFI